MEPWILNDNQMPLYWKTRSVNFKIAEMQTRAYKSNSKQGPTAEDQPKSKVVKYHNKYRILIWDRSSACSGKYKQDSTA